MWDDEDDYGQDEEEGLWGTMNDTEDDVMRPPPRSAPAHRINWADRIGTGLIVLAILVCAVLWIITGQWWVLFLMIPAALIIAGVSYLTTPG